MASKTSPKKRSQIDDLYEKQLESQKHKQTGDDVRKSVDNPITPLTSDDAGTITERDKSEYLQIQTLRKEGDILMKEVETKQVVSVRVHTHI